MARGLTNLVPPATLRHMVARTDARIGQLRRGVLEFCVLALLREGELYAFDLVRALGDADGLVTSEGTLYPLLARLRREGSVESSWRESASGPPRRYYRITKDGEAALRAFAGQWARFRDSVDNLIESGAKA
jgi:PadR family transcriptional regulator, regulatory protein PadR